MCVNADGDYVRTVQNTVALVAKILKEENLTINDVVQHNYYSGKIALVRCVPKVHLFHGAVFTNG